MNSIYLIGIFVIVALFYYRYKRDSNNKKQTMPVTAKEIKPEIATKNKWLYPEDDFGKMEKGVVSESRTYVYQLNENTNNIIYAEIKLMPNETKEIKKLRNWKTKNRCKYD